MDQIQQGASLPAQVPPVTGAGTGASLPLLLGPPKKKSKAKIALGIMGGIAALGIAAFVFLGQTTMYKGSGGEAISGALTGLGAGLGATPGALEGARMAPDEMQNAVSPGAVVAPTTELQTKRPEPETIVPPPPPPDAALKAAATPQAPVEAAGRITVDPEVLRRGVEAAERAAEAEARAAEAEAARQAAAAEAAAIGLTAQLPAVDATVGAAAGIGIVRKIEQGAGLIAAVTKREGEAIGLTGPAPAAGADKEISAGNIAGKIGPRDISTGITDLKKPSDLLAIVEKTPEIAKLMPELSPKDCGGDAAYDCAGVPWGECKAPNIAMAATRLTPLERPTQTRTCPLKKGCESRIMALTKIFSQQCQLAAKPEPETPTTIQPLTPVKPLPTDDEAAKKKAEEEAAAKAKAEADAAAKKAAWDALRKLCKDKPQWAAWNETLGCKVKGQSTPITDLAQLQTAIQKLADEEAKAAAKKAADEAAAKAKAEAEAAAKKIAEEQAKAEAEKNKLLAIADVKTLCTSPEVNGQWTDTTASCLYQNTSYKTLADLKTKVDAVKTAEAEAAKKAAEEAAKKASEEAVAKAAAEAAAKKTVDEAAAKAKEDAERRAAEAEARAQALLRELEAARNNQNNTQISSLSSQIESLNAQIRQLGGQPVVVNVSVPEPQVREAAATQCSDPTFAYDPVRKVCVPPTEVVVVPTSKKTTKKKTTTTGAKKTATVAAAEEAAGEAAAEGSTEEESAPMGETSVVSAGGSQTGAGGAAMGGGAAAATGNGTAGDDSRAQIIGSAAAGGASAGSASAAGAGGGAAPERMYGAAIQGQTGPGLLLYPIFIASANGIYYLLRRRRKK